MSASKFLPGEEQLEALLELKLGGEVGDLLTQSLLEPLNEFLKRPAKKFRGEFVELGFQLARLPGQASTPLGEAEKRLCAEGAEVLEAIHAGSLVVDDIQDGSLMRRGHPTLHLRHGLALALNAGNWLYFWPFERVRRWGLPPERELAVYHVCHRALLKAHFGQALDVGVPIDSLPKDRIPSVSLASLELKTGALMALALALGAVLGGADAAKLQLLDEFGHRFGVALQMFDDVGNLSVKQTDGKPDGKQYEDLSLRRPSWVWAVAAEELDDETFEEFKKAVMLLPVPVKLDEWLARHPLRALARGRACDYLAGAVAKLRETLGEGAVSDYNEALSRVTKLGERLTESYE